MNREMRRKDRMLTSQEAMDILENNAYGVLSMHSKDGMPYGVPMHYAYVLGELYFHSGDKGGLKTECLERNSKVCFTVVEPLEGVRCRSVILFGELQQVPSLSEEVLHYLIEKFVPKEGWEQAKAGVPFAKDHIIAYRLHITHSSAKMIDKPEGR